MQLLKRMVVVSVVLSVLAMVLLGVAVNHAFAQNGEEEQKEAVVQVNGENVNYYMGVVLGAALAAGFGFLGAGYAVARVGAAALGAASERPEILARSIVLVALAGARRDRRGQTAPLLGDGVQPLQRGLVRLGGAVLVLGGDGYSGDDSVEG